MSTTPPVGPRGLRIRVAQQGATAFREGRTLTACPYDPEARPFSASAWVGGFLAAARAAGVTMPGESDVDQPDDTPTT